MTRVRVKIRKARAVDISASRTINNQQQSTFSYSIKKAWIERYFYTIGEDPSGSVRFSITIVHIRKFFKMHENIARIRFVLRKAKRSIWATLHLNSNFTIFWRFWGGEKGQVISIPR